MVRVINISTCTSEYWRRLGDLPADRSNIVQATVEAIGGQLVMVSYLLGPYDVFMIADLPSTQAAAALSILMMGTGMVRTSETYEMIALTDLPAILAQVGHLKTVHTSPPNS